jgi:hypothetical protein
MKIMKKILLSIITLTTLSLGVNAQLKSEKKVNDQSKISQLTFYTPQVNKKVVAPSETSPTKNMKKAVLWSEDFANGMNSTNGMWTQSGPDQIWKKSLTGTNGEWSTGTPAFVSTSAANGFMLFDADSVNFIVTPNYTDLSGALISPSIDLSGQLNVQLTFEHNYRFCCGNISPFVISLSNDGGANWTDIDTATAASNAPSLNPELGSIDISTLAGNQANVQIKFTFGAATSTHYYWIVDDISIESFVVTEVKENVSKRTFNIHPNPSKGYINIDIKDNVKAIKIIDITGKTVKSLIENSKTVNTSDLPTGVYFIQVKTNNELLNSKFVKE